METDKTGKNLSELLYFVIIAKVFSPLKFFTVQQLYNLLPYKIEILITYVMQ